MQMLDSSTNPLEELKKETIIPEVKSEIDFWPVDDLPSLYKLYPQGTKIFGRSLKVAEVKKLSMLNETNYNFVINEILKVATKGIKVEDILLADKIYIIMWLRCHTYRDPGYVIEFKCPLCEKDSTYEFSLENLDVKYLPDNFDISKTLTLKTSDTISFNFLTIKDEQITNKFKQTYLNSSIKIDDDILDVASMIKTINGEDKGLLNKYEFVTNLTPQDYVQLKSFIKQFDMGIKPIITIKCDSCGGESQTGLTFQSEFFIPSYKF